MKRPTDEQMLETLRQWRGDVLKEGIRLTNLCSEQGIQDVRSLAAALGVDVEYRECPDLLKFGGLLMPGKDMFIIVNSAHHYLHQELTIAHEIAHYTLHEPESVPLGNRARIEFQAQALGFLLTDTIYRDKMFDILDRNHDLKTPIIYAWMPEHVLCGSRPLRALYKLICSLES